MSHSFYTLNKQLAQQRSAWHSTAKSNDRKAEENMEVDHSSHMRARKSQKVVGDQVLLRCDDKKKSETRWYRARL